MLLLGLVIAACAPSSVSFTSAPSSGTAASGSGQPGASIEASAQPPSDQPAASEIATDSGNPATTEPDASASSGTGPAAACSGTDKNREFFATAAAAVTWTVHCAVLPAGWFVDSGQYRGTSGGWVQISYKGPGGARFELHEGAFCTTADGCVPPGTDSGEAPFGDQTGTLVRLDGGGWAVVVDRGTPISWLAIGTGMDEVTLRRLTDSLDTVGA